ncbi:putative MFS family arabinose efflux permease [Chitinophaga polysaccharea]|uniref:Putative MFS family arabinose efflux permease n=1 Tax=Chitinophaga polysaccharea TaxID=1293035 RepID=A0A561PP17_9BACT|nr:MFS transporter [Chitinophaga polysaccharea]TWF39850.1 putative MFS family arabinose efflux permease [Chitinophaga polysaccharea]
MRTSINTRSNIKESNIGIATILAFAMIPMSGFATDIYLPSLPGMTSALGITNSQAQLTLSLFLISYGVSQLFVGGLLDSYGRYKISMVSMFICCISCVIVANTHSIYVIYAMRIVHGITMAAMVVSKRAFFVDLYSGEKLKHYLSYFTIIWSTGPIIAPFIGGYLEVTFGWESNFYFLGGFAGLLFILELIFGGETIKHTTPFHPRAIFSIYYTMARTSSFTLGIGMLGLAYSMVMVYNMSGPFIIEHYFNLSPVITGYCSLFLGLAWMAGGFLGKGLINKPFVKKMNINVALQFLAASLLLLTFILFGGLWTILVFAFLVHVGAGFTYNNYFTYCLQKFPRNAGIAGGLTGGVCYVIVSILSYSLIYLLPAKDGHNLSYSYLLLIIISGMVMYRVRMLDKQERSA